MESKNTTNSGHRIRLVTTSTFDLSPDEIWQMYLYLALFQYRYLRVPEYNEKLLLQNLNAEIKKFICEIQNLTLKEPNNLTLNKMRMFFENHHKHLKEFVEKGNPPTELNQC